MVMDAIPREEGGVGIDEGHVDAPGALDEEEGVLSRARDVVN